MDKTKPIKRIYYDLQEGDAGIYETVNYMWHYAIRDSKDASVKQLVSSLQGSTEISTIRNIFDWVWHNVEYKLDPSDREMITAPSRRKFIKSWIFAIIGSNI